MNAARTEENRLLREKLADLENRIGALQERADIELATVTDPHREYAAPDVVVDSNYEHESAQTGSEAHLESKPPVVDDVSYFYEPL